MRANGIVVSEDQATIEVWEVVLTRPRDVPFTIVGRRSTLDKPNRIGLAWLPKASSQSGTLLIGGSGGAQFDLNHADNMFTLSSVLYRG